MHLWSSCTAPQSTLLAFQIRWYTSEGPWPAPPFLHMAPLSNPGPLGSPLGEDSPFAPTHQGKVEWCPAIFMQLCGWPPEGHSLLVGHPFDLDIAKVLVLGAEIGILSTSWAPISSSASMSTPTHWCGLGWPQSLSRVSLPSGKGGSWVGTWGMEE